MVFETDWTFWLVLAGFIIAFVLAFGIGANDVANSFGTSVGSKVLTLKQACILATIFEILGSILIGAQVSGTIRKGIVNPAIFTGSELELMLGYVSSLASCCIWLIVATVLNLPVSGTHSIVGAIVGMALVSRGFNSIEWWAIAKIVASWFISPLLSGLVSAIVFFLIRRFILRAEIEELDVEVLELAELPSKFDKKTEPEDLFAYNDPPEAAKLFSFLQVLTAICGSFAHGGYYVARSLFRNIIIAWIVTVPVTSSIVAGCQAALKAFL